jgi:2-keto-4-pentenoate hydratase/2-oxohepta-3-ene-1,7-dioic acid hydratase in catechol pathway
LIARCISQASHRDWLEFVLLILNRERGMTRRWVRFSVANEIGFGTLAGEKIQVYSGDMFGEAHATGIEHELANVKLLAPTVPGKVIALWNNFMALAAKLDLQTPLEPLYFLKSPNSYLNPGEQICAPAGEHKIMFEGELGVVIGKTCKAVSEADADGYVFGYTCANDVTAANILHLDPTFAQWVRAKGFDTFCPLGPTIASGLDVATLRVKTTLNGTVRQDYPISDMRFSVPQLVSTLSHDMTLFPGDVILCGTSVGVGSMKPGSTVEVEIGGIGTLRNTFN